MSKIRWVVVFLTILFTLTWLSLPASAEEVAAAYSISGYKSDVTLYADGSVYFDEYITYRLLQESAEVVKPIPMSNASGIEGLEVFRQEPVVPEHEGDTPELTALAQSETTAGGNGDVYTYTLADKEEDVYHISIPIQGKKREEKTFVFRYKLKDTVFLYKDTAAFFWQFIMPHQDIDTRNVQIQITLPAGISVDEMNGFISGSPYAAKEELEDGTFRITADRVKPDETLETALLIPNSLFPDGRKVIDNFAEDAIISDMTSWESEADRARKKDELRFYGGWAAALLSVLLSVGTGFLLYLKAGRKPKLPVQGEGKGLPAGACTPAELGVLLNRGKVGAGDLFSTVLHLIQSGYLELQFNEKKEGSIALKEEVLRDKLLPHEEYVLNWLTKDLGNGRALSLEALEQLLNGYSKQGGHKVSTWETLVRQKAAKWKFEEKITQSKTWGMGAVLIGLLAALLAGFVLKNLWAGVLSAVFALALAGYIIPLKKRSIFGWMQIAQWQQFKEYLSSQLSGPGSKLPMFVWEQYLVYAVPLGMAKEILEKLPQICKKSAFEDGNLTILYEAHHAWLTDMLTKLK
jgi:uncharacterized membrane protein